MANETMTQATILNTARDAVLEAFNLVENENYPYKLGIGERGGYITVTLEDGKTKDVPVTIKVTAHKDNYNLDEREEDYLAEMDERKRKADARAEKAKQLEAERERKRLAKEAKEKAKEESAVGSDE